MDARQQPGHGATWQRDSDEALIREAAEARAAAAEARRTGRVIAGQQLWKMLLVNGPYGTRYVYVHRVDVPPADVLPDPVAPHRWAAAEPLDAYTLDAALRELSRWANAPVRWEVAAWEALEAESGTRLALWWEALFPDSDVFSSYPWSRTATTPPRPSSPPASAPTTPGATPGATHHTSHGAHHSCGASF
ncbi:hypothetical protein [Yinghuangia soli]|uniref:Uncharacterized protein n=1 Tax=Yinghuangia soli TaxID=2908204 RepID=A0AA41U1D3_9ACTN|nr:hypothetical protein [Yinghuangia soli]MCF2526019.1 hypothetical protein [Yinghuangia soli]